MRAFIRASLEDESGEALEVVEAPNGFDALRLLPRDDYALVITDINMPDINGLELLQFIRRSERHQGTPVLLISTRASERDRARGRELGADAFLEKPFTAEALREAAMALLATGGGRSAAQG